MIKVKLDGDWIKTYVNGELRHSVGVGSEHLPYTNGEGQFTLWDKDLNDQTI